MKKLYVNIEKVKIKGGPRELYSVIKGTEESLRDMAEKTEKMTAFLSKYSESNKGVQFEKLINSTVQLRSDLSDAAIEMNDMLVQVVIFVNKINQYEDNNESLPQPAPYVINGRHLNADTGTVQFEHDEMLEVERECKEYREGIYQCIRSVNLKKNNIASVWMDPQYDDYSDFIQDLTGKIVDALKVYDEYLLHLDSKIRGME